MVMVEIKQKSKTLELITNMTASFIDLEVE